MGSACRLARLSCLARNMPGSTSSLVTVRKAMLAALVERVMWDLVAACPASVESHFSAAVTTTDD